MPLRGATLLLVAVTAGAAIGACRPASAPPAAETSRAAAAPDARALREVPLPDLGSASASVREQIQSRHAEVSADAQSGAVGVAVPPERLAASFGELGQLLLAADFFDAAEPALRNAQALSPSDARWPYYLGHVHRRRSELDAAAAAFARARELQRGYVPAAVALADVHLTGNKAEAAEAVLREVLAREPENAAALDALGRAQLARRDHAAAIASLERALRADPQATAIHYPLSLAYRAAGNAADADRHLARRGTTPPKLDDPWMREVNDALESATALDRLSRAALARGDWGQALAYARRGLALAADNPRLAAALHHRIGTALAQTGDGRGAVGAFAAAVGAAPDFAPAHYSLGLMMMAAGRGDEAIAHFSDAITHQPTYVEARLAKADLLRQGGRAADALAEYRRVLDTAPRMPPARYGEALALGRLGRYAEARDRLAAAVGDHPGDRNFTVARDTIASYEQGQGADPLYDPAVAR